MTTEELTCMQLVEIVTEYIEGALAERDVARFDEHLAECEGCENYLDQMRVTIEVTGSLTEDNVPDEVCAHMLTVFRDWNATHP